MTGAPRRRRRRIRRGVTVGDGRRRCLSRPTRLPSLRDGGIGAAVELSVALPDGRRRRLRSIDERESRCVDRTADRRRRRGRHLDGRGSRGLAPGKPVVAEPELRGRLRHLTGHGGRRDRGHVRRQRSGRSRRRPRRLRWPRRPAGPRSCAGAGPYFASASSSRFTRGWAPLRAATAATTAVSHRRVPDSHRRLQRPSRGLSRPPRAWAARGRFLHRRWRRGRRGFRLANIRTKSPRRSRSKPETEVALDLRAT